MATSLSGVDTARDELCTAAARGRGGRAALQRFSDCVDDLLQRLYADAPAAPCSSLLVALGGYGRRQLCLHSDVDVLILFDGPIGPAAGERVRAIL
ncbi:MAG: hypothetical protein HY047_13385, partial [Acidobacteria bacterium]|nr:hypothetical protein [Acidobacteriota bacterium]